MFEVQDSIFVHPYSSNIRFLAVNFFSQCWRNVWRVSVYVFIRNRYSAKLQKILLLIIQQCRSERAGLDWTEVSMWCRIRINRMLEIWYLRIKSRYLQKWFITVLAVKEKADALGNLIALNSNHNWEMTPSINPKFRVRYQIKFGHLQI